MYRLVNTAALSLVVAACATAPPPPPAVVSATEATPAEEASDPQDIAVVDVPGVPESAVAAEPRPGGGRVCRLEKRTGSNRAVRVCRSIGEIQGEAIEAKETFDRLRRSQTQHPQQ